MQYNHTQIGRLMIGVLIAEAILFTWILMLVDFMLPILIAVIFILLLVGSFVTLNVRIDQEYLRIKFGYGIFRKKFRLADIVSVKAVRHKWYHGWGIRYWFWPYMWIYNVSGFDAVEIEMTNGKIFRIGTDEVQKLENALKHVINK